MSKLIPALLLALALGTAACDEDDDKRVERESTGVIDDISNDTDTDTDTDGDDTGTDTDGDDEGPGCLNALPPTGGPVTTLDGGC